MGEEATKRQILEHLLWYCSSGEPPRADGEALGFGIAPPNVDRSTQNAAERPSAEEGASTSAAKKDDRVSLDLLIDYLEMEVATRALRRRAAAAQRGENHGLVEGLQSQRVIDAYVSQLVTRVRAFPYHRLAKDRRVGAWVRDDVIAPVFQGCWDFYANRKCGNGLDLHGLARLLCGEGFLLERLHYTRQVLLEAETAPARRK
eukprot:TRINITY_DN39560_c0_g1_i1.p1 TRINITY_DN39560_c0_g1~~TRINITY_DN39560_c0_g1_i1.p1  ORF type:complete len:229 (+),score=50.03 TRINITY_DN39560_c0_g1_i1:81-689(+)